MWRTTTEQDVQDQCLGYYKEMMDDLDNWEEEQEAAQRAAAKKKQQAVAKTEAFIQENKYLKRCVAHMQSMSEENPSTSIGEVWETIQAWTNPPSAAVSIQESSAAVPNQESFDMDLLMSHLEE